MDTIFALASARGKAGVAVVRISGPRSHDAVQELAGDVPGIRRASVRRIRDSAGKVLDEALILVFAEGHSFTGEASAELHLHGSQAIVSAVLARLGSIDGLRLAEAGEFTRRALENDRLDLARVEGLADLIEAETEAQRIQAMRVFSGALGEKVALWRQNLVRAAALIEATIDFADEDIPEDVMPEVDQLLSAVEEDLARQIAGATSAERIRDGFEVAIVGPTNVGKSTLLNRLAGRDAAITSEVAGTTRDVIEVRMDLRGLPVTFLDTAGLRETTDTVESIGISRARTRAEDADLRVFLLSERSEAPGLDLRPDDIVLLGKADLGGGDVSGLTGAGVDDLVDRIFTTLEKRSSGSGLAIRERHRVAMEDAVSHLRASRHELMAADLVAEELRRAIISLDVLVGRVDVEHLLDEIFASFCLGK